MHIFQSFTCYFLAVRCFLFGIFGLFLLSGCSRKEEPEIVPVTAEELLMEIQHIPATVRVVNFWASWCIPCREEFPDFLRLERAYTDRGLRVFFVSIDFPEDLPHVRAFLREQGVAGRTFLKVGKDEAFIVRIDSTWTGAIPATVVYDADGEKRAFVEGRLDYVTMQHLVDNLLDLDTGG